MSSTSRRGSSISTKDENLSTNVHFKWGSIRNFLYIGFAFSTTTSYTELFVVGADEVRIYDYMLFQILVGIAYLFMDFFIKQYTKRLDFMTYLNPLLKGIISGSVLQVSLLAVATATFLVDIVRYLIANLRKPPTWGICTKKMMELKCITLEDVSTICLQNKTMVNQTSAHFFYIEAFQDVASVVATSRTFISAIVWMANFFCSTLTDAILVKIMKISFYWSTLSSLLTVLFLVMHSSKYKQEALHGIFNITTPATFEHAIDHAALTYSVGLIGLHDYSSMSPYTMIDNTVVIFTIVHTLYAFCRALTSRILILKVGECIKLNFEISELNSHYAMFVLTPLSMHFLPLEYLFTFNLFLTKSIQCGTNVSMITVTIARMLQNEFRSIRIVYIVGLLCSMGFLASLTMTMNLIPVGLYFGIISGLRASMLFLGGYKVALIMYVYGIQNFTTDVHFWLGYKPTKFWTLNWMLIPIILLFFFLKKFTSIYNIQMTGMRYAALGWIAFTTLLVMGVNFKVFVQYLKRNNVMGIFRAHPKYGPLDREYLQKRKIYSETLKHKVCKHHCMVYDESYTDCDHKTLIEQYDSSMIYYDTSSSSSSIIHGGSIKRFFSRSSY